MNKFKFYFFILFCLSNTIISSQQAKSDSTATVLFICEHGAARSVISAAFFNRLAEEKGLKYKAVFRGIHPDSTLSSESKKGLVNDGFDIKGWQPEKLSQQDINRASKIITLDCNLSKSDTLSKPVNSWNGIPPIHQDYSLARDYLLEKIRKFIIELER